MHAHTPTHTPSHLQTPPVLLCQRKHSSSPSLLPSPRRMQLGLKWNVKVALKRCLLYVNSTRHTYCSQHAGQNILSLLSTHTHTHAHHRKLKEMEPRCGWGEKQRREKLAVERKKKRRGKSGGGAKSGDRKIRALRHKARLWGPQGLGVYVLV